MATRRNERGFTLIELGIILAIAAILAAMILPDRIDARRNKMLEKTIHDIALLHDAGRRFYATEKNPLLAIPRGAWPGRTGPASMGAGAYDNLVAYEQLQRLGFVPGTDDDGDNPIDLVNPWGFPYRFGFVDGAAGTAFADEVLFVITTAFPRDQGIEILFQRYGVNAGCGATCPNSSDSGFSGSTLICCSAITRPSGVFGMEAGKPSPICPPSTPNLGVDGAGSIICVP